MMAKVHLAESASCHVLVGHQHKTSSELLLSSVVFFWKQKCPEAHCLACLYELPVTA